MIDATTTIAFSIFENRGVYALLLGSGLSRAAQIPTGWEITIDLIRRLGVLEGAPESSNWEDWYRGRFGKEPRYSDLLDALSKSPHERRALLHSYIEPDVSEQQSGRKVPTAAHKAIAKLVAGGYFRLVLTTNFDRLLENARREEGVEPTILASDDALHGAVPLIHSRATVIKIHGDYLDTRIKNTEEELSQYSAGMNDLIGRIFDEHGLIICGWSGDWDLALRDALLRTPNRRYPIFWTARSQLSRIAQDVATQREAQIVQITDADAFFSELERKISTQESMRRRDPRSTELLIERLKKCLSREEFRIELHDVLQDEARLLQKALSAEEFGTQIGFSREELTRRISRYETLCEPLVRAFLMIGRWGSESDRELATSILRDVAFLDSIGGQMSWIGLRAYPAALLFYAAGLGFTVGSKYGLLFQWLTSQMKIGRGAKPTESCRCLYLSSIPDVDNDFWRNLIGQEQSKNALSNHLLGVFRPWTKDLVVSERQIGAVFERFEILASLSYAVAEYPREDLKKASVAVDGSEPLWVPVGRFASNREFRDEILVDIQSPQSAPTYLAAGFGRADPSYWRYAIGNLERFIQRIRRS